MKRKPKGWRGESRRHSIAAKKGARRRGTPKGWNEIKYNSTYFIYKSKKNQVILNKKQGYWHVTIKKIPQGHFIGTISFKTKSAALAYAKDWMRRHPNG